MKLSLSVSEDFSSMFPAEVMWGLPLLYAKLQHNDIHLGTWYIFSLPPEAPSLPGTENQHRSKTSVHDCMLQTVEVRN